MMKTMKRVYSNSVDRMLNVQETAISDMDNIPGFSGHSTVYHQEAFLRSTANKTSAYNLSNELDLNSFKDSKKDGRMQATKRAANFINSNMLHYTYQDFVKMLKSYFLKLEKSTTSVPTYDELSRVFCGNELKVPQKYNE